ncbi:MAG TPA: serine protease [Thermoanaerobaculia bacterium]|nr:serine protease [Thermoanaerobaculia bacterium]
MKGCLWSGRWKKLSAALMVLCLGAVLSAEVPTVNVIYRVLRIRTAVGTGSAFTLEVEGKQYLITARHNLKDFGTEGSIDLWIGNRWTRNTARAIYPSNETVDIAALDLGRPVTVTFPLEPTGAGLTLGQQVYFLGYPFGLSTFGSVPAPPNFGEIPFLKSGIISALDTTNPEANILYLDGQNNPGFSGGPIVFWHAESGLFRVAGVISGYRNEALPVLKRKDLLDPRAQAYEDLYTRANSGIVVGYDIRHILDAIRAANRASRPPAR